MTDTSDTSLRELLIDKHVLAPADRVANTLAASLDTAASVGGKRGCSRRSAAAHTPDPARMHRPRATPSLAARVFALASAFMGLGVQAQPGPYPNRSIRVVVAYPPGGGADLTARLVAQKMGQALGQNLVIQPARLGRAALNRMPMCHPKLRRVPAHAFPFRQRLFELLS